MDLENVRFLLEQKKINVSLEKQKKIFDAIQTSLAGINEALEKGGSHARASLQNIEMIENDISWNFTYMIHESHFIG